MKSIFHIFFIFINIALAKSVLYGDPNNILALLKAPVYYENELLLNGITFKDDDEMPIKPLSPVVLIGDKYGNKKNLHGTGGDIKTWYRDDASQKKYVIKKLRPRWRIKDIDNPQLVQDKYETVNKPKYFKNNYNTDTINDNSAVKDEISDNKGSLLNLLGKQLRRAASLETESEEPESSDVNLPEWKDEWLERYMMKKIETLNNTMPIKGDVVGIAAARPWGVPCGDPAQHDMPWGSCMLTDECEPEYRIYRGDVMCGRTSFVCCLLQTANYDLYQALDASFDDKSLSTDIDVAKGLDNKNNKKEDAKKKRDRNRKKRKKRIKKRINTIIKEISQILNKIERNGTKQKKKKTKMLKKFVKQLKAQYKKDRLSVVHLNEQQHIKIDFNLMKRLNQILAMNKEFINNATFREILVNGTITKNGARMLGAAFPELAPLLPAFSRRSFVNYGSPLSNNKSKYFEYDIEYGLLYY